MIVTTEEYNRKLRGNVVVSESGQLELPEEWDYEVIEDEDMIDAAELARRRAEILGVSPTQFVEFAVRMPDKKQQKHIPFSFKGRKYLKLPYDTGGKRVLLKCGRQVEKSTMLGNKCLSYVCIINAFNILYVSPSNQQTKTFSQDRLKEPIETSEVLRAWTYSKGSDSVFQKKFINRSQITLRYAFHNADRCRGIPADLICIDEIQDINTDNIPVIEECASHSPFKFLLYSGTPKTYDNAIEHYWVNQSTQNEWVVPCEHHGVPGDPSTWYWNVLGEDNIERKGLVCSKCRNLLNPMHEHAQWAQMNAGIYKKLEVPFEGYRVPQLMVPWLDWSEIYQKYISIDKATFYNEVLGMSYDTGTRPLTQQDMIDNCNPGQLMDAGTLKKIKETLGQVSPVFAGIDWGTGEGSYTVMSLGAYLNGKFTIFYTHRFTGQEIEPPIQLDLIDRLIRYWNVETIGADYGGGFDRNDHLARKHGASKIAKYQYSTPNQKVRFDNELRRFLVNRTEVMSDIFNAIKRRDVFRFPDWQHFEEPHGKDFLSIFSEYNEQRRQIEYKKSPDATDDTFHSVLYCFLASMLRIPRYDVLNPSQKVQGGEG